jgi:hypothetical protein
MGCGDGIGSEVERDISAVQRVRGIPLRAESARTSQATIPHTRWARHASRSSCSRQGRP